MERNESPRPDWARDAEQDLGATVPHAYLPIWISAPAWLVLAWGSTALQPPVAGPMTAGTVAVVAIATGMLARRRPCPTLLRFWAALVAALFGFIFALLLTLNTDSLLRTTWATAFGMLLGYSLVMTVRRDITAPR